MRAAVGALVAAAGAAWLRVAELTIIASLMVAFASNSDVSTLSGNRAPAVLE